MLRDHVPPCGSTSLTASITIDRSSLINNTVADEEKVSDQNTILEESGNNREIRESIFFCRIRASKANFALKKMKSRRALGSGASLLRLESFWEM